MTAVLDIIHATTYNRHTASKGQKAGCMPLGMDVGLSPGDFVLDSHPFSVHVCCGQTAAWIKMPLGTKVGLAFLRDGDIVFNVDSATPQKGHTHPHRDQDPPVAYYLLKDVATYLSRSRPNFWPMSIVAKWLDGRRRRLVRK